MQYASYYNSPLGKIFLASDEAGLIGLWFVGQKYFAKSLQDKYKEEDSEIILRTKSWLDVYFSGVEPDFIPPVHFIGSEFQRKVWRILQTIPYGQVITYKEVAEIFSKENKIPTMSARAVGTAIGRNNISIIVPCHRVIGTNSKVTGYAAGIDKKIKLLQSEGISL